MKRVIILQDTEGYVMRKQLPPWCLVKQRQLTELQGKDVCRTRKAERTLRRARSEELHKETASLGRMVGQGIYDKELSLV